MILLLQNKKTPPPQKGDMDRGTTFFQPEGPHDFLTVINRGHPASKATFRRFLPAALPAMVPLSGKLRRLTPLSHRLYFYMIPKRAAPRQYPACANLYKKSYRSARGRSAACFLETFFLGLHRHVVPQWGGDEDRGIGPADDTDDEREHEELGGLATEEEDADDRNEGGQ